MKLCISLSAPGHTLQSFTSRLFIIELQADQGFVLESARLTSMPSFYSSISLARFLLKNLCICTHVVCWFFRAPPNLPARFPRFSSRFPPLHTYYLPNISHCQEILLRWSHLDHYSHVLMECVKYRSRRSVEVNCPRVCFSPYAIGPSRTYPHPLISVGPCVPRGLAQ